MVTCCLTEQGQAVIERLGRARQSWIEHMAVLLNDNEVESVVRAMEIMVSAVERHRHAEPTTVVGQQMG